MFGSGRWILLTLAAFIAACSSASTAVFPIDPAAGDQQCAVIYGDIVVWEDYRNEATSGSSIYAMNLDTMQGFPVCTAPGNQWLPAIWENKIVWQDARGGRFDIYSYDLLTGLQSPLYVNAHAKWNPAIHGNRVVWEEEVSTFQYDIYSIEFGSSTAQAICTAANSQYESAIYGDVVVWEDLRGGSTFDIYSRNLATGVETPVCTAAGDQMFPDIWGTRVVWEDYRSGTKAAIYMEDLATGVEKKLTTVTSDKWQPAIWGNYVVWQDKRNGDWDLYMYDIAAGQERPLLVTPGDQQFPRIYENKVVYQQGTCGSVICTQTYMTMIVPSVYQTVQTAAAVRALPDGAAVMLTDKVVTRSFGGTFYVEETDRSSGIRVRWPAAVEPGTVVTVTGTVRARSGEREIEAADILVIGAGTIPRALTMTNREIGGTCDWPGALPWVGGTSGALNTGLLISTAGRVTAVGNDYFYLTDGSADLWFGGALPVRIICGNLAKPAEGQMVFVTGISSTYAVAGGAERAVRVQHQNDMAVYQP